MRAARIIAERLEEVQRHEPGLPAADPVHDTRVAVRRLRAALRLLELREVDPPVKALQDALGAVRDLQLQIDWLAGRDEELRRRREAALRRALRALEAARRVWRARTLPRLLDAARHAPSPGRRRVRRILRTRLDRLGERLDAALVRGTPAHMHRARI
jgi:CHAD domain-containing protein